MTSERWLASDGKQWQANNQQAMSRLPTVNAIHMNCPSVLFIIKTVAPYVRIVFSFFSLNTRLLNAHREMRENTLCSLSRRGAKTERRFLVHMYAMPPFFIERTALRRTFWEKNRRQL